MTSLHRFPFVHLDHPSKGRADGRTVYLTGVSLSGMQILHQVPLKSDSPDIEFEWDGKPIRAKGSVVESFPVERRTSSGVQHLHETQLDLKQMDGTSREALRELVEHHVERALDEQKSNLRGVPPHLASSYQTNVGKNGYRAWHLHADGSWSSSDTEKASQPVAGFTVSRDERDDEVAKLRDVYLKSDEGGRELIRRIADLSISDPEGIPARKYEP